MYLKSILIRVLQHGAERFDAVGSVILGVGKLGGAVLRHLRQQAGGVVFAVNAAGVGVNPDLRHLAAKTESEITELVMAVAIEE